MSLHKDEQPVDYLAQHPVPEIERLHMDEVKRRMEEIRSGQVQPINGDEALAHVRNMIKK